MNAARLDPELGYMPLIPEPFWLGGILPWRPKTMCQCGEKFRDRAQYEAHYALTHITEQAPE